MNISRQKHGKYAELRVATELLKKGIPVYFPFVDDEKVDLVVRISNKTQADHWDIQVKSAKGYNQIIGVPWSYIASKPPNYLLVAAFIHARKPDEFFFLTVKDLLGLMPYPVSVWGDLRFNKPEREKYRDQTIANLPKFLVGEMGTKRQERV
ncbi:hypothetical protein ES702_00945 [subsurface metagenome]